jgi:hypothetical protein
VLGLALAATLTGLAASGPALGSSAQEGGTPPPASDGEKPADEKPADKPPADSKPAEEEPKNLEEVMERINKLSKAGHKAFLGKQYPAATETVKKLIVLSDKVKTMLPADVASDEASKKEFLALHDKMEKSLKASHERLEKKQFKDADLEYKKSLNVCTQCHRQFRIDEE